MRIIAGMARGTRLKMVPGKHVRPTADRVKESLFGVIGPYFAGGKVLDLFAGTGALGLEALSRGMDDAVFVDSSKISLNIVKENATRARLQDRISLFHRDARQALRFFAKRGWKFDLIFLDPPYDKPLLKPILKQIAQLDLLTSHGIIVVEFSAKLQLPSSFGLLQLNRLLSFGDTNIALYEKEDKGGMK